MVQPCDGSNQNPLHQRAPRKNEKELEKDMVGVYFRALSAFLLIIDLARHLSMICLTMIDTQYLYASSSNTH